MARIPLPVKVLVSYIAVLTAGALPAYLYVDFRLEDRLLVRDVEALRARAVVIAPRIARQPENVVTAELQAIASLSELRITAIRSDGAVFFESGTPDEKLMVSHAERPEVVAALGSASRSGTRAFDPTEPGFGADRRVSVSTGEDTLYLAIQVPSPVEEHPIVLRLASDARHAVAVRESIETYLRNALAVSLSIALLFTLLAALFLVRPIARIRDAMKRVSEGDYGPVGLVPKNDELGDVARALEDLTRHVRTRVASAGSGEGVIMQLVDALTEPVAIATTEGRVIAMNGAARRFLGVGDRGEESEVSRLFTSKLVKEACARSEEESEPVPVELKDGRVVFAAVLKRPTVRPLFMLLGRTLEKDDGARIPHADRIVVRSLDDMLTVARDDAKDALDAAHVTLALPESIPEVSLVDADERASRAVASLFSAGAWGVGTRPGVLAVRVDVESVRVRVSIDGGVAAGVVQEIAGLIEPLGGSATTDGAEVNVWLPRA
jgi:HAMP domain-containing protein